MERIERNGPHTTAILWYSTGIDDQNVHGDNYGIGALGKINII